MHVPRRLVLILASLASISLTSHALPAGAIQIGVAIDNAASRLALRADFEPAGLAMLGVVANTKLTGGPALTCTEDFRSFTSRNTIRPSVRKRALAFCRDLTSGAVALRNP